MSIQTRNKIGAVGFILLFLGLGGYWAWATWFVPSSYDIAMTKDISKYNNQEFMNYLGEFDLHGTTSQEREAMIRKLAERFKNMSSWQRLVMFGTVESIMRNEPTSQAAQNIQTMVLELWFRQARDYYNSSLEERQRVMDKYIDGMEKFEQRQQAKGQPGTAVTMQSDFVQRMMANVAAQSLHSSNSTDRAQASQFISDMKKRRQQRGLSEIF